MTSNSLSRRQVLLAGAATAAALAGGADAARAGKKPAHIIDSHVHLWAGHKPTSPSHRPIEAFTKDDLLKEMDAAGVERATIVPTSWDPHGNQTALDAARAAPNRLAVMGLINPLKMPEASAIENWTKTPGMVGMRMFLGAPPLRKWFEEGGSDALWSALERTGTPIMIFCGGQMPVLEKIAQKYPKMKICIDSWGGIPGKQGAEAFTTFDSTMALAKYPNVTIKPVSMAFLSGDAYPFKYAQPLLRKTYDAFGPQRMFWGSDVTLSPVPMGDVVKLFTDEMTWLTDRDLELIMGRSISAWLNWPLPA